MMHLVLSGGKILKLSIKKIEIMAILKYGNNILTYNGNALEAVEGPAPLPVGYWKHKDTGVVTEITLIWQDGFEEDVDTSIMRWNPSTATSWDSVDASEIKFPEGVEEVGFLTDEWTPNIVKADLPSTTKSLGHTALNGITMMESLTIRALVPPTITLGIPQSPNLRLYVPSESLNLYKSTAPYSSFAEIIFAIP
jgi:hypothetical protein